MVPEPPLPQLDVCCAVTKIAVSALGTPAPVAAMVAGEVEVVG